MSEINATECPICGGNLFGVHCKQICRNCGYKEDCSDLFPESPQPRDAASRHESGDGRGEQS